MHNKSCPLLLSNPTLRPIVRPSVRWPRPAPRSTGAAIRSASPHSVDTAPDGWIVSKHALMPWAMMWPTVVTWSVRRSVGCAGRQLESTPCLIHRYRCRKRYRKHRFLARWFRFCENDSLADGGGGGRIDMAKPYIPDRFCRRARACTH